MQKVIYFIVFFLLIGGIAQATNPDIGKGRSNSRVSQYIDGVFAQLRYKRGMKKMKPETFRRAYYGYLNLLEHGKVRNRRYLTICDFSLSSNVNRLWLVDVTTKQVVYNTLVAHGSRTGEEFARFFSNLSESHQSSLGFYITRQTYSGKNGYSMRMDGVDGRFNSNAYSRDVVMHGASYVSHAYARANKRIGRSWGCPSVGTHMAAPIIDKIKNGSVLFIHYPSKSYLRTSYWLNNRVGRLPRNANTVIAKQKARSPQVNEQNPGDAKTGIKQASDFLKNEKEAPVDTPLATITEFQDPEEIQKLKKDKSVKIQKITIPKDQITPEMREKALKKKKVVRKVNKITILKTRLKKAVTKE